MLSEIKINNFKIFDNIELHNIKNLVILTGPNNAGKSSILQAVVFIRNCIQNKQVLWDSKDLSLRNFAETVYGHDRKNKMIISCVFDLEYDIFGTNQKKIKFDTEIHLGRIINQKLVTSEDTPIITWSNKNLILHKSNFNAGDDLKINYKLESQVPFCSELKEKNEDVTFITDIIKGEFNNIYYLAPNRGGHEWEYVLGEEPSSTGSLGENTASYLHYRFSDRDKSFDKLESWIKAFDTNITLIKSPLKSGKTHIKFDTKIYSVNLIGTGSGLNTVIPVVMTCIYSPKGSTILIEEPEIHLHTKALNILLDLFLNEIYDNDKQIIFTTHSWDIHRDLYSRISHKKISEEKIEKISRFDFKNENGKIIAEDTDLKVGFQKFIADLKELLG